MAGIAIVRAATCTDAWVTLGAAVFVLGLVGLGLSLLLGAVCGRATASEDGPDDDAEQYEVSFELVPPFDETDDDTPEYLSYREFTFDAPDA